MDSVFLSHSYLSLYSYPILIYSKIVINISIWTLYSYPRGNSCMSTMKRADYTAEMALWAEAKSTPNCLRVTSWSNLHLRGSPSQRPPSYKSNGPHPLHHNYKPPRLFSTTCPINNTPHKHIYKYTYKPQCLWTSTSLSSAYLALPKLLFWQATTRPLNLEVLFLINYILI